MLSELDLHSGVEWKGFFPMCFRELASVLGPKLCMVFCRLLREMFFLSQWCCADVVPIRKGAMPILLSGVRPISSTIVLSKVYERLVSSRLCAFTETEGVFPRYQFAYRKRLETCDALLDIAFAGQPALERERELAVVQIDFSVVFDRVSRSGLL